MKIKKLFKILIFSFLIGWPFFHMGLVSKGLINSWKLSGWGMYATTSPKSLKLKTVFLRDGIDKIPTNEQIHLAQEGDSFLLVPNKGYFSSSSIPLTQRELSLLGKNSEYVRALPTKKSIKNYMLSKKVVLERKTRKRFSSVLLFISERRLDMTKMVSFFKTKAFLYKKGTLIFVGKFDTSKTSEQEVIKLINLKLKT